MMLTRPDDTYQQRRGKIEAYFDRTALRAWEQLTSDAPVSRVRATVRAGRDRMRQTLLDWLPSDLSGRRVLDAGCGTGSFALELARRGAQVLAIDLSPSQVDVARRRIEALGESFPAGGGIDFRSGDMSDRALGRFDHVVSMDSLIHYSADDALRVLHGWGERTAGSMVFTFAPSSPLLRTMHAVGKWFPRGDRAPAIVPVAEPTLRRALGAHPALTHWTPGRSQRVASGFYTSQGFELTSPAACHGGAA